MTSCADFDYLLCGYGSAEVRGWKWILLEEETKGLLMC